MRTWGSSKGYHVAHLRFDRDPVLDSHHPEARWYTDTWSAVASADLLDTALPYEWWRPRPARARYRAELKATEQGAKEKAQHRRNIVVAGTDSRAEHDRSHEAKHEQSEHT